MTVTEGKWYTYGESIREAVSSSIPGGLDARAYFDMI